MIVRPLVAADHERWSVLWDGYLTFYEHKLTPEMVQLTWQRLLDPMVDIHGLAAEQDGEILGITHYLFHPSTWSDRGYCYLEDLFTAPDARGRGVGRALIEAVHAAAQERGATRLYWTTQTSNTTARTLYDRVGKLRPFVIYEKP